MHDFLEFLNQNSGAFQFLSAVVVAIATIVYVTLTHRLVAETKTLRESETDCYLIVSPEHGNRINSIDVVIRNVGNGAAYDISCQIGEQTHAIRYIAPGKKLRIEDWDEQNYIEVKISYNDFKKRIRKDSFPIDIEAFKKRETSEVVAYDPLDEIDETLQRIARSLPERSDRNQQEKLLVESLQKIARQLEEISSTIRNRLR